MASFMGSTVTCRTQLASKANPLQHRRQHAPRRQHCTVTQASAAQAGNVRISVQGRNIEVTPAINEYASKKVASAIDPFKCGVRNVDVRFSVRGGDTGSKGERQQKMEVTIRTIRHGVVRAEEVQGDLYAAIDVGCDKVVRSMRKLKEKSVKRGQWPGRGGERGDETLSQILDDADSDLDVKPSQKVKDEASRVIGQLPESVKRTKVFYLDAMTLEDAVDKLQLVDHDFYIYLDQDSGHTQVVYKRSDGSHGVIITVPEEDDADAL